MFTRKITEHCNFVFGISDIHSLPKILCPEIAFVGRSNVGKSSLINLLINSKKAARVSSKPGCTQQINFYSMYNDQFRIVDLPGYGYANLSKTAINKSLQLIKYYLNHGRTLRRIFVLIDSRIGLKDIDKNFVYWLLYHNITFNVVLTKTDQISHIELDAIIDHTRKWINNSSITIYHINIHLTLNVDKVRKDFFKFTK
ncbi:ribosome biogenesis GTP-binding protein YihA/YsxC [Wolbachia endosymbiont of Howardula sp.]|uniref:ribosome biogenesis GTP-binding protein YihA/YsxC n=1 Tax=Wolbachia endosymbiont of Howardula sp. TaxID=2916816 RepID=UPI00217D9862|nr:ribosome biogenesis GTP-binding protein YihA/YsxC [Wolbachia endosymbiont of Howardula sp.]UWI83238.1 ribosome biogenesis GTP-binding protein YihA/YsxC [Wolbachia endosymbiont of Howardula sp.]